MNPIHAKFRKDFPLLMHQKEGTSFTRFGLEVAAGWYPLVYELLGFLDDLQQLTGKAIEIRQIKEKYGELRLYMNLPGMFVEEDILEGVFEFLSSTTCDVCGAPGKPLSIKGYDTVRCPAHSSVSTRQAMREACRPVIESFPGYQRRGIDTSGIVYLNARESEAGEGFAHLTLYHFPDRILDLKTGLADKLRIEEFLDQPVKYLVEKVQLLDGQGKILIGVSDGSPAGRRIIDTE